MSISYWLDQSAAKPSHHYDYVIVGAGIAGLSLAYWLQREEPQAKIAILEKHRVAFGASGRNAGFVTCGSTEHFLKLMEKFGPQKGLEIWRFSEENRRLLMEHIIQDRPQDVDFQHTGSCTVAPSEEHWEKYREAGRKMSAAGLDVAEVSPESLRRDYGLRGFVGGLLYRGDGFVHPVKLLGVLRSKLKVDIFEGTEVHHFHQSGPGKSVHVLTDQGTFSAMKVLLAVNAYLPMILKNFEGLVCPQRAQVVVTKPLPMFVKGPCYLTKFLCYFRQLPTGHLLVGGFRNLNEAGENTALDQTTPVIQEALLDFIRKSFQEGQNAEVAYQWSGIMGFTPDGQMLIGSAPGYDGITLMAGCGGHGMGLSFHAAKVTVGSLFGRKVPEHLDIRRFQN